MLIRLDIEKGLKKYFLQLMKAKLPLNFDRDNIIINAAGSTFDYRVLIMLKNIDNYCDPFDILDAIHRALTVNKTSILVLKDFTNLEILSFEYNKVYKTFRVLIKLVSK